MAAIDKPLKFVLAFEGGFVHDPLDRGGATNKGVTTATYNEWRERKGLPSQPVKFITDDEVRAIYEEQYWRAARCPVLPSPLNFIVFDSAVQHGVSRAVKWLQELTDQAQDGVIGPKTLAAVASSDIKQLAENYLDRRELFYQRIVANDPTQSRFARGWNNRMQALRNEVRNVA